MATTEVWVKSIEQAFNDTVRKVFPEFCTRTPSYRYFYHKGNKDMFFWTTEAITHNGKPRYASGTYRYLKTKKQWRLTGERYHALRKDAKARALQLFKEAAND